MKYELVNPHDPIFLETDDERFAKLAVLCLSTAYGIRDTDGNLVMPILLFGGMDEFLANEFGGRDAANELVESNLLKIADVLDSFSTQGDRTSLSDVCTAAKSLAQSLRKRHSAEAPNAT